MIIVQVAGRLGTDVETRVTPDGTKVSTLRLATNIRRGNRDETVWWRITLWGDRWDKMLPYLTKGSALIVVGEMQKAPEIYNNRDGQPQISLEIRADIVKFSPFGRTDGGDGQQAQGNQQGGYRAPAANQAPQQHQQQQQPSGYPQPYGQMPAESTVGTANQSFGNIPEEDLPF